ncbi:hypothetical protein M0802_016619, partial [Mischocyttarus mexicanus]
RVVGAVVVGAAVCGRIPGLAKSQREQCRKAPHAMPAVGEGAELGLRECRHQFRHHRWNCSNVANDQVFGHVVVVGEHLIYSYFQQGFGPPSKHPPTVAGTSP